MKKFLLGFTALAAFIAAPAMAGSNTHISFGVYSPAPFYYEPPVVYYPPVHQVYYAPRVVRYEPPCPSRYGYGVGYGRGHGYGHNYVRHDRGYRNHRRDYAGVHYVNQRSDWNY